MATSQNGWPVLFSGDPRLHKWLIPGASRHLFLRNGSAGFLIGHFALWFHERIERLDLGVWDDWGWAVRPIAGQVSGYSNHASATAADINATKHPLGVPTLATFTRTQVNAIHRALDERYSDALRWGGDYENRPDAMHIEIQVPLAQAERAARKILATPRSERLLAANPGQKKIILA